MQIAGALVFFSPFRFHSAPPTPPASPDPHAPYPLPPADPSRDPQGGGGLLPPADVAGRADPPGGGRHLRLAAARFPSAQEDRTDRSRGAGSRGCDRALDAHLAAR